MPKEITDSFEVGKEYTDREVNIIIADFNDDFCTIRRDMISEGILERNNMINQKTNGTQRDALACAGTYVCENPGFGSSFYIALNADPVYVK